MEQHLLTPITYLLVQSELLYTGKYGPLTADQTDSLKVVHEAAVETYRLTQKALKRYQSKGQTGLLDFSHDWLTPLATVLSYADYLLTEPIQDDQITKRLTQIYNRAVFLRHQMMNLLDYARWLNPTPTIKQTVHLSEVLQPRLITRQTEVEIKWDRPPDLPHVTTDAYGITRTMDILLDNALRYTPLGSVRIRAYNVGQHIAVTITDTGIGIPYQEQERLFEPFRKGNPDTAGIGLGLALAKRFVQDQGSVLRLLSEPDKGTTVTFTVPIAKT